jgi:hypothetical protein
MSCCAIVSRAVWWSLQEWKVANKPKNEAALRQMQSLMPANIRSLSVEEIVAAAEEKGGLMTYDLALYLKNNKLVQWVMMHPTDIAHDNFLSGEFKASFTAYRTRDVIELRALIYLAPEQFLFDTEAGAPKATWLAQFLDHVRAMCGGVWSVPVRCGTCGAN